MNRNMVRILILVSKAGSIATRDLSSKVGLSYASTLRILKELDRLGLVRLHRGYVESVPFLADLISQVSSRYPLEEVLVGKVPLILSRILEPKSVHEVSFELGLTERYIRKVLSKLSIRGIVRRGDSKYTLVLDPQLRILIIQIVRLLEGVESESRIAYRDNYYIIKEVPRNISAVGVPTAFSVYHKYGIPLDTDREIFLYPPKKVSLEEIIVHSLLVAKTKQEHTLTALLYAKYYYELDHSKLMFYAQWFKQTEKLFALERYLAGSEEPQFLPWSELENLATMYDIDLSPFKRRHFGEEILALIGKHLEEETKAILFGGVEMVLKKYKTSTKDIDIAFLDTSELEKFIKAINKLGYIRKSENDFMVYEDKRKSRIDIYLNRIGKIPILPRIIEKAEEKRYGKLRLLLLADTDLLLTKLVTARPRDIEDAKKIIRMGMVDWREFIDTLLEIEEKTKHHYCLLVLSILENIEKDLEIHIPLKRKLLKITTEHMVLHAYKEYGLKNPKDIRKIINISEETINRILKKAKKFRSNTQDNIPSPSRKQ